MINLDAARNRARFSRASSICWQVRTWLATYKMLARRYSQPVASSPAKPGGIEPVDRQRDLAGLLDVEQGANREDVDDAAVAPVEPVELDRLDEQR